ncbi:restriction endonuclease subunit S [Lachnospira pectinoschiza]|uniref:restriction endonuclease subunit S n=1 Tax=Lachnospira pectinoschiza TaxID=28052 RepID=UPI001D07180B|nr:restriction endonuclease subunit S [Lachnospira pectinoschiza]MCB6143571.1 restriction endonuclease subunit S [Lachnospira pectinoschiza]
MNLSLYYTVFIKNFNLCHRQISQFGEVAVTTDNLPYEKVGKNEPVCIADEVPFEIPESWEWVRLGELFQHNTGKALNSSNRSGELLTYITTSNLYWNRFEIDNLREMYFSEAEIQKCTATKGDLLVCEGGDIGRAAIWSYDTDIRIQNHIHRLRSYSEVCVEYYYYIFFLYKHAGWIGGKGIGIQGLSSNALHSLLFPLPPLQEQCRIVTKIKEIVPFLDKYEQIEQHLNDLNVNFPEMLKKSILQEAVQGKLVTQDPSDEPASVLLERIRAEKERLIQEGKIKRDKHESIIYRRDNSHYEKLDGIERCLDDEIPFEIPSSWAWIRLGSLFTINPRNNIADDTVVGFMPMPLLKDGFNDSHTYEKRLWKEVKSGFTHFANNDVVIAKITPCFQNRKSAVIHDLPSGYGAGTTELHVLRDYTKMLYMPYFLIICKTHAFIQNGVKNFSGTAGQQRVGKDFVSNYLVPLPPVNEQKRIVEKVNNVINSCDIL